MVGAIGVTGLLLGSNLNLASVQAPWRDYHVDNIVSIHSSLGASKFSDSTVHDSYSERPPGWRRLRSQHPRHHHIRNTGSFEARRTVRVLSGNYPMSVTVNMNSVKQTSIRAGRAILGRRLEHSDNKQHRAVRDRGRHSDHDRRFERPHPHHPDQQHYNHGYNVLRGCRPCLWCGDKHSDSNERFGEHRGGLPMVLGMRHGCGQHRQQRFSRISTFFELHTMLHRIQYG